MEMFSKIIFILLILIATFIASSICTVLIYRVKVAECTEKVLLIRSGFRIIVHSGVLLACLQTIAQVLNEQTKIQLICDSMKDAEKFNAYFNEYCIPNIWSEFFLQLFLSGITAVSWLVPFLLAATGVNILSQGLLLQKTDSETAEDMWCKNKPSLLSWWLTWLSKILT